MIPESALKIIIRVTIYLEETLAFGTRGLSIFDNSNKQVEWDVISADSIRMVAHLKDWKHLSLYKFCVEDCTSGSERRYCGRCLQTLLSNSIYNDF
jgi:hypothetical protein